MPKPTHPGYLAIRKEALELGWPKHFRRDLTFHDRRELAKHEASEPFVWVIREAGTHLLFPRGYARHNDLAYLQTILRTLDTEFSGGRHWFYWDGQELWHSSAESVADRCLAEFPSTQVSDISAA